MPRFSVNNLQHITDFSLEHHSALKALFRVRPVDFVLHWHYLHFVFYYLVLCLLPFESPVSVGLLVMPWEIRMHLFSVREAETSAQVQVLNLVLEAVAHVVKEMTSEPEKVVLKVLV